MARLPSAPDAASRGRGGPSRTVPPPSTSTTRELQDDDLAFDATLRERTRMADALHDGALQEISALQRNMDAAGGQDAAQQELGEGLRRVIEELRTLTGAMHEPSLDDLTLRGAVDRIVAALRIRHRIEIAVDIDAATDGYNDPTVRESVRELTTNIAQHANASLATISIAIDGGDLVIRVGDDGSGVDPAAAEAARAAGHIGLCRLQRRADRLGGSFDLRPAAPVGTVATVRLPAVGLRSDG